jgi:hypothetical protein
MTSQGTPHGRFTRCIASGNLRGAEMAARELGRLSLDDALSLCVLFAEKDRLRLERAALRWLERLIAERSPTLEEVGDAVMAFMKLRDGPRDGAVESLLRLTRSR